MAQLIELRENAAEIQEIADRTAKVLDREHGVIIGDKTAVLPTIVHAFLSTATSFLAEHKPSEPGQSVEINLMQLLDIGISFDADEDAEKEGNYTPYLRPGQEMKLLVKDDNNTEEA